MIIGKLHLWDCRRDHLLPNIYEFKIRLTIKYEIERYISEKIIVRIGLKKMIFPVSMLFT